MNIIISLKRSNKKKKYERLIEVYTLNQWQFRYLEWTIEKTKQLNPMVNPSPFIMRPDPANDYLVHLTDCFDLFSDVKFFKAFSFLFLVFNTDLIFNNNRELRKEYENFHKNILISLNNCGNCDKFKCNYCLKFLINCSSCIREKCKNCHEFNKSKSILLNSSD